MMQLRRLALLPALLVLLSSSVISRAQNYTSIVVFGDSLSDTGNDAHLSDIKYGFYFPGPIFDYTAGRFTDGYDTIPAALDYRGVWIEQLAAMLPSRPVIKDSLDGGKNYSYGFAFTDGGTTDFTFSVYSITIENVGKQITQYLATHPKIDDKTLFVVWAGANDVLNAASSTQVVEAAIAQAENVERLIDAGATQFIVADLPPLGAIPRLNGSPTTSVPATEASVLYNATLAAGLTIVHDANFGRNIRLYPFDVFSLFNKIIKSPAAYGLVNVTSSSQGVYPLNPDTYLFWDDLHPTTHGHNILAVSAAGLIEHHECLADHDKGHHDGTEADWECVLP
jgi:phospholipase/lecithinase/hemolysin